MAVRFTSRTRAIRESSSRRSPKATRGTSVASFPRRVGRILAWTGKAFYADNITRLGAALAFYTTVAVAPLLVLAVAVAGFFFEGTDAREKVVGEISSLAGAHAGKAIESVQAVETPANAPAGRAATAVGIATLLFGAFGVFHH